MKRQLRRAKAEVRGKAVDFSAMTASVLCALHCAALPIAVGLLPAGLLWMQSEWMHKLFVLVALPISGYAIARSIAQRTRSGFVLAASLGLVLLTAGAFIESLHDYETPLTLAGAALLILAHLYRWLRTSTQVHQQVV